jgi:hypothetical protein
MTHDNLCGADGLRAPDPVAEARDQAMYVGGAERIDAIIAAVRVAALEEAAAAVESWAEPAIYSNQNITRCTGPTNEQCAIAAAIRRLKEGT